MERKQQNNIKTIIGKYKNGEISFGEMLKRISVKPTVRNFVIIVAIIAAFASVKDIAIKKITTIGDKNTSTSIEQLEQIIITIPIKQGDTLNKIAERFGTTTEQIAKYNGIQDPNKIVAGRTLQICLPLETQMDIIETYEVKEKDSIQTICEDNKMTVEEFIALNPNVIGVAEGDKVNILVERQTREYRHYMIEEGDTINEICEKFEMDVDHFLNVNNMTLETTIYPGEVYIVHTEEAIYESYEVKKDETIQDIAEKFEVTVNELMNLNEITEVIPGEIIEIPSRPVKKNKILGLF